jgi:hypothetical protein
VERVVRALVCHFRAFKPPRVVVVLLAPSYVITLPKERQQALAEMESSTGGTGCAATQTANASRRRQTKRRIVTPMMVFVRVQSLREVTLDVSE